MNRMTFCGQRGFMDHLGHGRVGMDVLSQIPGPVKI